MTVVNVMIIQAQTIIGKASMYYKKETNYLGKCEGFESTGLNYVIILMKEWFDEKL
jgi:hypothetical protein